MKFWDSSALALLTVNQTGSKSARTHFRLDPMMTIWAFTRVEVTSALQRLRRAGKLDDAGLKSARTRLTRLLDGVAAEVVSYEEVRERAERLLALHPLRAADALQLAAALVAVRDKPRDRGFVVTDGALAEAARREGFDVRVPED